MIEFKICGYSWSNQRTILRYPFMILNYSLIRQQTRSLRIIKL